MYELLHLFVSVWANVDVDFVLYLKMYWFINVYYQFLKLLFLYFVISPFNTSMYCILLTTTL